MVVWTRASTGAGGGFVKDEAARAARRRILVPVTLDKVEPPLGFGELQAIDLTRWRGSTRDPFLQDLVAAIESFQAFYKYDAFVGLMPYWELANFPESIKGKRIEDV